MKLEVNKKSFFSFVVIVMVHDIATLNTNIDTSQKCDIAIRFSKYKKIIQQNALAFTIYWMNLILFKRDAI